jgi:hypothetical protein
LPITPGACCAGSYIQMPGADDEVKYDDPILILSSIYDVRPEPKMKIEKMLIVIPNASIAANRMLAAVFLRIDHKVK